MNTQKSILVMVSLICLALIASPTTASNENLIFPSYNQTIEIRPEIGSAQENGVVGEHGYKVFHPGAIAVAPIVSIQDPTNPLLYRSGSTDAWLDFGMGPGNIMGWNHFGGHQSGSDLWEEQIWADGFLKVTTDPSWRTICSNHTSGTYAYCSTSFFHLLPRTINAKTNHFFHKSGYYDQFFSTSDGA